MRDRLKFNIFIKLLVGFMLVFSPFYVFSLNIYNWGESEIKKEVYNSVFARVDYYLSSFIKEMNHVIQFQREYLNNDRLQRIAIAPDSLEDYERARIIQEMSYHLLMIQLSSAFVDNSSVYIPSIARKISSNGFHIIPQEEFESLSRLSNERKSPIIYLNGKWFITEVHPFNPFSIDKEPIFLLGVELSKAELMNFLHQITTDNNGIAILQGADWSVESAINADPAIIQNFTKIDTDKSNATNEYQLIKMEGKSYIHIEEYSSQLGITLSVLIPEENVVGKLKLFRSFYWILLLIAVVVVTVFSYWAYRTVHRPLTNLVRGFGKVESGNLMVRLAHRSRDEFQYLYQSFNQMVGQLKLLIEEVYEQKISLQRSELKQLQSQINPHFLYNSYYILHRMATLEGTESLQEYTKHLGDYFQYVTRNDRDVVKLEEEWAHTRSYVEIQKYRFAQRIAVTFEELPAQCRHVAVPRLILQPIVENAYKYALEEMSDNGILQIRSEVDHHHMKIIVEDNGPGLEQSRRKMLVDSLQLEREMEEVTALVNIHRRLQLMYGKHAGLVLENGELGGLKVTMIITLNNLHMGGNDSDKITDRG